VHEIQLPRPLTLYHIVDACDDVRATPRGTSEDVVKIRVAELERSDGRATLEAQFGDPYCRLKEYTLACSPGSSPSFREADVAPHSALCEFPVASVPRDGERRGRFCWTNAASHEDTPWLDGIQKVDMATGAVSNVVTFGAGTFAGAPTFVPRAGSSEEDEGYILTFVYDSLEHKTNVFVLDSATLENLCQLELTSHVPYHFHTDFCEGYLPN